MSLHFAQGFKLAIALLAPVVTTVFFRARALAAARTTRSVERPHGGQS
jgi:hypothetical protein